MISVGSYVRIREKPREDWHFCYVFDIQANRKAIFVADVPPAIQSGNLHVGAAVPKRVYLPLTNVEEVFPANARVTLTEDVQLTKVSAGLRGQEDGSVTLLAGTLLQVAANPASFVKRLVARVSYPRKYLVPCVNIHGSEDTKFTQVPATALATVE